MDVNYKFYKTPNGGVAVLPGANIAAGSGLSEIDYNTFKSLGQGIIQNDGRSMYDQLLNGTDPNVAAAIRAGETGATVKYGQVQNGNLISNQSLAQDQSYKNQVANGSMKVVGTQNGIPFYQPTTPFTTPSYSGPGPGQPGYVVPQASVPTSASGINSTGAFNFPNVQYPSGNIANAVAGASGAGTQIDALVKAREAQIQAEKDAIAKTQAGQNEQSFLSKLLSQNNPDQVRANATAQTGIDPNTYFSKERSIISEIDSLTQEYNKVKADKDAQIAATNDKLASTSFINNQTAQIERNAAPRLNELSANINAKAATLKALQGSFNEAQDFIRQAVSDATAMQKYNYDMYTTYKSLNKDTLDSLDKPYKDAFDTALDLAKTSYQTALTDKTKVGSLAISADGIAAGVNINDTYDQAIAKISRLGKSAPSYRSTIDNITHETTTKPSTGFSTSKIESDARQDASALLDQVSAGGGMTLDKAYSKMRLLYSPGEVSDSAIKSLLGINPQPTQTPTTTQTTPTAPATSTPSFIDRISNWLFNL